MNVSMEYNYFFIFQSFKNSNGSMKSERSDDYVLECIVEIDKYRF